MRLVALLLFVALLPVDAAATGLRRFALVAGANDGGTSRVRLRYAGTDAQAVSRVLADLGGVAEEDRILLLDPDRRSLQAAFVDLRERLDAARPDGQRLEVFVYYSGHSDEEGLLLGEERFGYPELRHALEALPADVRVAILDSCSSGAFTRRKGGKHRPPFLVDASTQVKGHAFLTSSSADEAAQESDRIGASFFTHFLVSGLRGAADTTRDGKVTLTEAYQFAFQETLARTEKTQNGAQHAAYEMQLVGTGDLVMTDLRSTSARLTLEPAVAGRIFVRDENGALVVELRKLPAAPVELGLAPGAYVVTVDDGGRLHEAKVSLAEGRPATLGSAQLRPIRGESAVARKGAEEYRHAPFQMQLVPDLALTGIAGDDVVTHFGLHLLGSSGARLDGAEFALGFNTKNEAVDGAQFAVGFNYSGGAVEGVQASVGANFAGGDLDGAQLTVGLNHANGDVGVFQAAVGWNSTGGTLRGAQFTTGLNTARGLRGLQAASGVNLVHGDAVGVQASSGVNWTTGSFEGVQFAAGLNLAGKRFEGAQIAAGVNVATAPLKGAQFGVVNVGRRVDGVQMGVVDTATTFDGAQIAVINVNVGDGDGAQIGVVNVNTGRIDGAQLGVFNYAGDSDHSLGVLSVVPRGTLALQLFADENNPGNAALKLGGRRLYGILTAGIGGRRTFDDELRWVVGVGAGYHFPLDARLLDAIDVELISRSVHRGKWWRDDGYEGLETLRVSGTWRLAEGVAVVAGPSLNVRVTNGGDSGFGIFGEAATLYEKGDRRVLLWPGVFAGLQLF